jgi:hypothetical protein
MDMPIAPIDIADVFIRWLRKRGDEVAPDVEDNISWSLNELLHGEEVVLCRPHDFEDGGRRLLIVLKSGSLCLYEFDGHEAACQIRAPLRGGDYQERLWWDDEQVRFELRYEHPHLPEPLRLTAQREAEIRSLEKFRDLLRQWATSES